MAVTNFRKSTQQSNAQLKQSFDELSDTLKQSLPELDKKQQEFERVIRGYQDAQAGFMDNLSQKVTQSNETLVSEGKAYTFCRSPIKLFSINSTCVPSAMAALPLPHRKGKSKRVY